ncbi:helix-turn-helix domain-containing protein [Chryseobacterium sp. A301]
MTSKEKYFLKTAGRETQAVKLAKERIKNREWLKESQRLAVRIMLKLDDLKLTQRDLASMLNVTPQYVNKLLKGKEKFGWEIIVALQKTLDMPILYSYEQELEMTTKSYINEIVIKRSTTLPSAKKELEVPTKCKIIPLFGTKSNEYESYQPAFEM